MLNVYKASAGSGKTFQLVLEYLKLILDNPYNYRRILAVTFTNKATNEMKSRILEQLHKLASNQKSDYLSPLQESSARSEQSIRETAEKTLKLLLHDYNRFSINTIDSFTQKVIKAFNRELGISPNFSVDIDNDMILQEATDRMFSKIGKDPKLLNWLREYSRERIEENRSMRIDAEIQKLGSELFKERFQTFFPDDGDSVYTRENLNELVGELRKIVSLYDNTLKKLGNNLVEQMNGHGLSPADFSGGVTRSIGIFFVKLANGDQPNFTDTVLACGETAEKWVTKTNPRRTEILAITEQHLITGLQEVIRFHQNNYPRYNSALAVLKQVRTLGILIDLKEEIKALLSEKDTLPLSDSNLLLNKIIGESDSPFVYEKMGTYYKHFMLDEFQDTSFLQWENFKPLLMNSLAEGQNNLIVGDVKQSIYRWRNSDWDILATKLDKEFTKEQKQEHPLLHNWRSDANIIAFNNSIFEQLLTVFEENLFEGLDNQDEYIGKFRKIYDSYQQEPGKKSVKKKGQVAIDYFDIDTFAKDSTLRLIEQVKNLQDSGIKASEIAILIRKNKEGTHIIEAFLEAARLPENEKYELSVLSNESLFLHASRGVLFIIHALQHLVDPENKIVQATLVYLWLNWLKPIVEESSANDEKETGSLFPEEVEKCFKAELSEKMEHAKQKVMLASLDEAVSHLASIFQLFKIPSELPFIQTLADKAGELKSVLSNDLSNFLLWWNEKGITTSVSVNEEVESIRLLTIHKAKGLEYKAILIPYFNWPTTWFTSNTPLLWCEHPEAPFNRFPKLPVLADATMKISEYSRDYNDEKVNGLIDIMNLIYVAFTRAKSVLIIHCPKPKINKDGSESSKGTDLLLLNAIRKLSGTSGFAETYNSELMSFRYGALQQTETIKEASNTQYIEEYHFNDFGKRVQLRLSGEEFLVQGKRHQSEKNKGKLIHEILSKIETTADVESACRKALADGRIDREDFGQIENMLKENLQAEATKKWFDGSYTILNERDVLAPGKLFRPDRIMYNGDQAIVIDYKTGEQMPSKYNRQVEQYASRLKETGFSKVEGYLWYLASNEIIKVCEL